MPHPELSQAAELIKQGQTTEARNLLTKVVRTEPGNAAAWYALSLTVDDPTQKRDCLRRAAALRPDQPALHKALQDASLSRAEPEAIPDPGMPQRRVKTPTLSSFLDTNLGQLSNPAPAVTTDAGTPTVSRADIGKFLVALGLFVVGIGFFFLGRSNLTTWIGALFVLFSIPVVWFGDKFLFTK